MRVARSQWLNGRMFLGVLMALGLLTIQSPSDAAARSGCATHSEIEQRLRDGMSLARVRRVVGARGDVVERSATDLFLEFRPCNARTHSKAYVQFDRSSRRLQYRAWDFGFYWIRR